MMVQRSLVRYSKSIPPRTFSNRWVSPPLQTLSIQLKKNYFTQHQSHKFSRPLVSPYTEFFQRQYSSNEEEKKKGSFDVMRTLMAEQDQLPAAEKKLISKKKKKSTHERAKFYGFLTGSTIVLLISGIAVYEILQVQQDSDSFEDMLQKAYSNFLKRFLDSDPPVILLEPIPYPCYSVVIDTKEFLISTKSLFTPPSKKKRPHIDTFIKTLSESRLVEVILWNSEDFIDNGHHILACIDNPRYCNWLFADEISYVYGATKKRLSLMKDRKLQKLVVVTSDINSVVETDNVLLIPKWHGEDDDKVLLSVTRLLLEHLRHLPAEQFKNGVDIRPFLQEVNRKFLANPEFYSQLEAKRQSSLQSSISKIMK